MRNEDITTPNEEPIEDGPVEAAEPQVPGPIVDLPSGASVELRPLTIADENYMAQAKRSRKGRSLDQALEQVLDRCTVRVADAGPYGFLTEGGRADWHRMLSGDRVEAMFALRKLSYKEGNLYVVENVTCPACKNVWDHEFNVDEDMFHQPLSEESRERYQAGTPFEVTVDGRVVQFQLQDGSTEDLFDKMRKQKPDRRMAAGLRSRIKDVEGIERRDIMDWLDGANGASKKFHGLTSADAEVLRDAFNAVDCGVDTEVEAECPECGRLVRFDLPFDSMFAPGRSIRARKRERLGMGFSAR